MSVVQAVTQIPSGWYSLASYRVVPLPPDEVALSDALGAFVDPTPLSEAERGTLADLASRTKWTGDEMVRLMYLQARQGPSNEDWATSTRQMARLREQAQALGLRVPEALTMLHQDTKLAHVLRLRLDSVWFDVPPEITEVADGVFQARLAVDVQGCWSWWLWLDRDGEQRVLHSADPPDAPRPTDGVVVCASSVAQLLARVLVELAAKPHVYDELTDP